MSEINGFCPMGCGWTLASNEDGNVICLHANCPRPTAVGEILGHKETEHVVRFLATSFTVRHPLRERLDDELMECPLGAHLASLSGPPVRPGTYRAVQCGGDWSWAKIDSSGADT